jgi:hypothetical protein
LKRNANGSRKATEFPPIVIDLFKKRAGPLCKLLKESYEDMITTLRTWVNNGETRLGQIRKSQEKIEAMKAALERRGSSQSDTPQCPSPNSESLLSPSY